MTLAAESPVDTLPLLPGTDRSLPGQRFGVGDNQQVQGRGDAVTGTVRECGNVSDDASALDHPNGRCGLSGSQVACGFDQRSAG